MVPKRFGGPWAVGTLVASLAVNLFFIGFLTTRHQANSPSHHGGGPAALERLVSDLSPAARKTVRDGMSVLKGELRPDFLALKMARDEVTRAIKADPLDTVALAKALDQLQSLRLEIENKIEQRFIAVVATLPPDDRRHIRVPDGPPPDGPPPDRQPPSGPEGGEAPPK